mgnify:CR=1 FL=1
MTDNVNNPAHYTSHPSGVECIEVTEHMGFNLGNAMKYIWRCDLKADAIEDLKKAEFYIRRELAKRERDLDNAKLGVAANDLPEGTTHLYVDQPRRLLGGQWFGHIKGERVSITAVCVDDYVEVDADD